MNKWDYYCLRKISELINRRVLKREIMCYAGRKLWDADAGNRRIGQLINAGLPFAACRFGSTELSVILSREAHKNHRIYKNNDHNLYTLSGFFPNDAKKIDYFVELLLNMIHEIDLLGVWFSSLEEYVIGEYMPDTQLTHLVALEPYVFAEPWSKEIKGKKVLVIHPFEESIQKQYARRTLLFQNQEVLPDFELKTLKAVQTIAGEKDKRFTTWFEALDYMKSEMRRIDFDIAIIGCGAYGMPLAIEAKKMGKQAVHLGGATQLLFGIMGSRWDHNDLIQKMYNEYWVRPGTSEQCRNAQSVENGCYW